MQRKTDATIYSTRTNSKKFVLSYGKNAIGYLKNVDDNWSFEYSDGFKQHDVILPSFEFPSKDKTYETNQLRSFFSSRIPSKINLELTDKNNYSTTSSIIELLIIFGKRTVNNPFVLKSC